MKRLRGLRKKIEKELKGKAARLGKITLNDTQHIRKPKLPKLPKKTSKKKSPKKKPKKRATKKRVVKKEFSY